MPERKTLDKHFPKRKPTSSTTTKRPLAPPTKKPKLEHRASTTTTTATTPENASPTSFPVQKASDKNCLTTTTPSQQPVGSSPEKSEVELVLKAFDLDSQYGPCIGITRKERYERALKLGWNPPSEIGELLEKVTGDQNECLWRKVKAWV